MEVKAGYKQTEVGAIPEEWEVASLESVAKIIDPQPDHRTPLEVTGGEPYIGISDFLDEGTVNWGASRKITSKAVDKQQSSFRLKSGDIIFGKIGTIGSPRFVPVAPFRYALSANVLLIQPIIEPNFVMSWLRSKTCERAVIGELHSTSQAAFGINKMRRVLIPLPPPPEQRAIAEALSDVDGLLGGLERLIAKKRDLKQAAMQQLLTGQTRLPGFHGEWEVKRLGDLVQLSKLGVNPFSTPDTLFTHFSLPAFDANETPAVETGASIGSNKFVVPQNAVLLSKLNPRIPRIWAPSKIPINSVCSTEFLVLKPNADVDRSFLKYLCLSPRVCSQMELHAIGTTGSHQRIQPNQAMGIEVKFPTDPAEQTAIAAVLSDMDAELAALEQRREKTRALKQAMMQELLTGRTRLV